MKTKITTFPIKDLLPHERIDPKRCQQLIKRINKQNRFTSAIIACQQTGTILDGHHRCQALLQLGYKKIPVYLVDYLSPQVRLTSRRKRFEVSKELVINRAKNHRLLPVKTTKHYIPGRPKNIKINLNDLL